MNIQDVGREILSLVEQYGPEVVGDLLRMVVPGLPIDAFVTLVNDIEGMLQARNEKEAMQQAVKASDATVDAEEQMLVDQGIIK